MKSVFLVSLVVLASQAFAIQLPIPEISSGVYRGDGGCMVTVLSNTAYSLQINVTSDRPTGLTVAFPPNQVMQSESGYIGFRNASGHEGILNLTLNDNGELVSAKIKVQNFRRTTEQSCSGLILQ